MAYIIQARMGSDRLPGKVLMPLPFNGCKPLLEWIIDTLQGSSHPADIIVATSTGSENGRIESFCRDKKVRCYRGDEENVLSRFAAIAKDYGTVVRFTGDNPLTDVELLDRALDFHFRETPDYTHTVNLPTGMNFEIVSAAALLDSAGMELAPDDREHVTMYIKKHPERYDIREFTLPVADFMANLRLTVDYVQDYALMSLIFSANPEGLTGLRLVESVYRRAPWLFELNKR